LLGLEITVYALFGALIMFNFVNQIEVPVGRGKPPVLIEKDESLDKVNFLMQQRHKTGVPFDSLFFLRCNRPPYMGTCADDCFTYAVQFLVSLSLTQQN
jgi:hypothetical protein